MFRPHPSLWPSYLVLYTSGTHLIRKEKAIRHEKQDRSFMLLSLLI